MIKQIVPKFKKWKIYLMLRTIYKKIVYPFTPTYPFHDDIFLQGAFILTANYFKPTSIVETGTFLGTTTAFIAKNFLKTPIYTCEINEKNYRKSNKNLKKYTNVRVIKENSPDFLQKLNDKELLGEMPIFFLDAHWENYWPLGDEINIITKNCKKAIIFIDDFKVEGNPQFGFDKYGSKECSLDLIIPKMNKKNKYHLLFPNYNLKSFSKKNLPSELTGYPIIFMNLSKEFKQFSSNYFIKRNFVDKSDLFKQKKG